MVLPHAKLALKTTHLISRNVFTTQRELDDEMAIAAPGQPAEPAGSDHIGPALMHYRARSYDPRLGRFIQKDPLIDERVNSPYVYVSNKPTKLSDPTGMYEEDFHYYAVFFLARAAGLSHDTAYEIGGTSQYMDDNNTSVAPADQQWVSNVGPTIRRTTRLHFVYDPNRAGTDANTRPQVTENNALVQSYVDAAIGSKDTVRVGIEIHALADSFSHAGFVGRQHVLNMREGNAISPPIGHGKSRFGGHEVDLPWRDVDKAIRASEAVYTKLADYARSLGLGPRVGIDDLKPTLRRLFAEGKVDEDDYDHDRNLKHRIKAWQRHMRNDIAFYRNGVMDADRGLQIYYKKEFAEKYKERFETQIRSILGSYVLP